MLASRITDVPKVSLMVLIGAAVAVSCSGNVEVTGIPDHIDLVPSVGSCNTDSGPDVADSGEE